MALDEIAADPADTVRKCGALIVFASTYNGEPPDNARAFYEWISALTVTDARDVFPLNFAFAVFGVGSSLWRKYMSVPTHIDQRLDALGGDRMLGMARSDMTQYRVHEDFGVFCAALMFSMGVKFGVGNVGAGASALHSTRVLEATGGVPSLANTLSLRIVAQPSARGILRTNAAAAMIGDNGDTSASAQTTTAQVKSKRRVKIASGRKVATTAAPQSPSTDGGVALVSGHVEQFSATKPHPQSSPMRVLSVVNLTALARVTSGAAIAALLAVDTDSSAVGVSNSTLR